MKKREIIKNFQSRNLIKIMKIRLRTLEYKIRRRNKKWRVYYLVRHVVVYIYATFVFSLFLLI